MSPENGNNWHSTASYHPGDNFYLYQQRFEQRNKNPTQLYLNGLLRMSKERETMKHD